MTNTPGGIEAALNDTTPLDRRLFLRRAALAAIGLAIASATKQAHAAKASDETLAALAAAEANYEAAMATLSELGMQLESAQWELSQRQAELDATNTQIAELEATIIARQAELEAAQEVLAARIRASYTSGNVELLEVLLSANSFEDLVSRIYYAGKVSDADASAIQDVKDIKAQLELEEAQMKELRTQQEQLVIEAAAYAEEISNTVAYYEVYVANLSYEVQALMAQAQAELEAAQQAEYEEYLRQQELLNQSQNNNGGGSTGGGDTGGDTGGGGGGGGYDYGSSVGGNGNHVYSVADIAWSYIGIPYVWGGTTPNGFDCSGLTQYCYRQAGYYIGRTTWDQMANISSRGQMVYSVDELQPGDLLFPHDGHVGIYMGGGCMIHAPYPGEYVQYCGVYAFSFGGCPV